MKNMVQEPKLPLEEGWHPKEQNLAYLSFFRPGSPKIIGKKGCIGVRYSFGLFAFEYYSDSDQEPELEPWRGIRMVRWQPLTRKGKYVRWWNPSNASGKQIGIIRLIPEYWKQWSNHARRHRRRWQCSVSHTISSATVQEFEAAYLSSGELDPVLRNGFMRVVRFHVKKHPEDVSAYVVQDAITGKKVAGLVTVDYPLVKQSRHTISFLCREARTTSIGYGLIDTWHQDALRKGMMWLDFGLVWKEGDPWQWRGYSRFKKQFGVRLFCYPSSYFRITISILRV